VDPLLVTLVAIIATPITAVLCAWLGFALGRKSRPECECRRVQLPTPGGTDG
jgi:hypothetical protein